MCTMHVYTAVDLDGVRVCERVRVCDLVCDRDRMAVFEGEREGFVVRVGDTDLAGVRV